jgi:hypothetical protein
MSLIPLLIKIVTAVKGTFLIVWILIRVETRPNRTDLNILNFCKYFLVILEKYISCLERFNCLTFK